MLHINKSVIGLLLVILTACASLPNSPSVMVLPGTGQSFEQFRNDEVICRQYASFEVGGVSSPNPEATTNTVTGAAVGTAVGAITGAAIGGGTGAAIGAGSGLVAGGAIGANTARYPSYAAQQYYDTAYIQCMYAKGHQVPVSGEFSGSSTQTSPVSQTPVPPPPAGTPPPPPPRK